MRGDQDFRIMRYANNKPATHQLMVAWQEVRALLSVIKNQLVAFQSAMHHSDNAMHEANQMRLQRDPLRISTCVVFFSFRERQGLPADVALPTLNNDLSLFQKLGEDLQNYVQRCGLRPQDWTLAIRHFGWIWKNWGHLTRTQSIDAGFGHKFSSLDLEIPTPDSMIVIPDT